MNLTSHASRSFGVGIGAGTRKPQSLFEYIFEIVELHFAFGKNYLGIAHICINPLFFHQEVMGKGAIRLQKRFKKHEDKILRFMSSPDIPPDNNGSERAIRNTKVKQKVSGGYRSPRGAERQAILLSVIETAKKQKLNVLETIQKLIGGQDVRLFGAE